MRCTSAGSGASACRLRSSPLLPNMSGFWKKPAPPPHFLCLETTARFRSDGSHAMANWLQAWRFSFSPTTVSSSDWLDLNDERVPVLRVRSDRPAAYSRAMTQLRALSSRATITPTRFCNIYNYLDVFFRDGAHPAERGWSGGSMGS